MSTSSERELNRAQIANDAGQRIEHPLGVLVKTGFVERLLPVGAPRRARPSYQITDPYLRFWFNVLYPDLALIDAGQGDAVLRRAWPRWQKHIGFVFEAAARAHAERLVQRGDLPADMVLGRWWSTRGPDVEVDVLGLVGKRTGLIGEAKWRQRPISIRDLRALQRKLDQTPNPVEHPVLAFWSRSGADDKLKRSGARVYRVEDMLD